MTVIYLHCYESSTIMWEPNLICAPYSHVNPYRCGSPTGSQSPSGDILSKMCALSIPFFRHLPLLLASAHIHAVRSPTTRTPRLSLHPLGPISPPFGSRCLQSADLLMLPFMTQATKSYL